MRTFRWFAIAAVAVAALGLPSARALASCGSDTCPLDLLGHRGMLGRLTFDVSYQYSQMDQVKIGTRKASVGELPSHDDEVETASNSVVFAGAARVNDRFSVSGSIPYVDRTHSHFHHHEGEEPELLEWSFTGIGDLSLLGSYSVFGGYSMPSSLSLQLGGKLPTGKRNIEEVGGHQPEPSARPGTGSLDGFVGAHYMHRVSLSALQGESADIPFFAGALYRLNGKGTDDYRIGNEWLVSAGGGYPITGAIQLVGQLNAKFREKDESAEEVEPGEVPHTDNTGGTAIYATPGLRARITPAIAAYGYFQFPLYERVNRIQLVAPYHVMVGTTYGFGNTP